MSTTELVRRAQAGLLMCGERLNPREPMAVVVEAALQSLGFERDPMRLIDFWTARHTGHEFSASRYPWEVEYRRIPLPPWNPKMGGWRVWRPLEQRVFRRAPHRYVTSLITPISIAHTIDYLSTHIGMGDAKGLLDRALPIFRSDIAQHVRAQDPWMDTHALSVLTSSPRARAALEPVLVALGAVYLGQVKEDGHLVGARFPHHGLPLRSASAQLARSLFSLGVEIHEAASLLPGLRGEEGPEPGWGDGAEKPDLHTTLAVASLLSMIDPTFDGSECVDLFAAHQRNDGLWALIGPDAPWFTWEVLRYLEGLERPFDERFLWPRVSRASTDPKTGLARFEHFQDLATFFEVVPGLNSARVELAFIDLAGFGDFNNRFGQVAGDIVLRAFAQQLAGIEGARAIRDGGDEFLVVGAPTRTTLLDDINRSRAAWPEFFERTFGTDKPIVVPRIVSCAVPGGALMRGRERLGRAINELKDRRTDPRTGLHTQIGA